MKKLITVFLIFALILPTSVLATDLDPICGRWNFYWDTRPMNEEYNNGNPMMSFIILNYDLYLFEDNTVYFVMTSTDKNGKFKLNWPAADGLWIANGDGNYTIRTLSDTYKAKLDDDGRLLVYMTKDIPYPYIRLNSYDFFAENP